MAYELAQIREAYIKLKSSVYYDNSDILLRRKLVEFDSNKTKHNNIFFGDDIPKPYINNEDIFDLEITKSVDKKLEMITDAINNFHNDPSFFKFFLSQIKVDFYPKKLYEEKKEYNFISNRRVEESYELERIQAFINAPIEIHILTVLWILENGKDLDNSLNYHCYGNRLLLNKSNEKIVQGSSLFKPYFKQYQKWRDGAVNTAQSTLKDNKNVLFLNLDIKDYYHSVRIDTNLLFNGRTRKNEALQTHYNLKEIFLYIHVIYTKLIAQKYQTPYNFFDSLKKGEKGELKEVIIPIGLLSSCVLANYYLREFDTRVCQKIKPAYYGRYVDDILIVISDPKIDYHDNETLEDIKFDFKKYKTEVNRKRNPDEKISFDNLTKLEKYVLENFHPVLKLIDCPIFLKGNQEELEKTFKINGYPSLFCQSKKSLVYFFSYEESDLVIDKLKNELLEKSSEFRDFPDDDKTEETFEDSAYHLLYDGTEGKIRTLKDYKENRYGLTVYLANKIFSALRHEKKISDKEKNQVLRFFRGANCLNFFRLWEKIFTFFLVNDQPKAYVEFYIHCVIEIEKIKQSTTESKVKVSEVINTLTDYLDCAHEIALSLNPKFISETIDAARNFEFQLNKIKSKLLRLNFNPTTVNSDWGSRFRETNMIRHNYVIHPLLNYTKKSKNGSINLTAIDINIAEYSLAEELLENSPRPVKFWECCLSMVFESIAKFGKSRKKFADDYINTVILGLKKNNQDDEIGDESFEFYLEEAFLLFKKINKNHIPQYQLEDESFKKHFYTRKTDELKFDKINSLVIQEINVDSNKEKKLTPNIAFANTEVKEENIVRSIRGNPNLSFERYKNLASILKSARKEQTDILLFPEFFVPINLLSSIVRHAERNEFLTVTGLEHVKIANVALNFIVTILPVEVNGISDAVVVFRLKNHYAPIEEELIKGNHLLIPKPAIYRYDIFNWRNLYFSSYYCFELANALHRSLMRGKIDLLIGVEWNKDTSYFSNIIESGTRDLHTYVAQVNTSQFGDSRLTQPVETARKDILRLKGGIYDTILVGKIDVPKLREFQRQKFSLTHVKNEFKPLPPDFSYSDVLKRINNDSVL